MVFLTERKNQQKTVSKGKEMSLHTGLLFLPVLQPMPFAGHEVQLLHLKPNAESITGLW